MHAVPAINEMRRDAFTIFRYGSQVRLFSGLTITISIVGREKKQEKKKERCLESSVPMESAFLHSQFVWV